MSQRVAVGLEYDGTHYHGWQSQTNVSTIQLHVENALSQVAGHPVAVQAAGRTDKGVHATAQVAHFDTEAKRTDRAWVFGANSHLPADIRLLWAQSVSEDFHARFSAVKRRYCYLIYTHPLRSALWQHRVAWTFYDLDTNLMQEAANYLLGEHDFSSFRGADCQAKSPIREVFCLSIKRQHGLIVINIEANAFLHHMVRNIAGVLMTIGRGKAEPTWAQAVLLAKNRQQAAMTAPAQGLYLVDVQYPAEFSIPKEKGILPFLACFDKNFDK